MNLDSIIDSLKAQGCRKTPLRVALIELMLQRHEPVSVQDLLVALKERGLSPNQTTLYRQLDTLVAHGVVDTVVLDSKMKLFEIAHDHHHHFVCGSCKDVQDVHSDDIESAFQLFEKELEKKGLSVQKHELTFFGACQTCH